MRAFVKTWSGLIVALLAGCVTEPTPDLADTSQASYAMTPLSFAFGTLVVGTSDYATVTAEPTNYAYNTIDAVLADCTGFVITYPALPYDVYRECAGAPQVKRQAPAYAPQVLPICDTGYIDITMPVDVEFRPLQPGSYACSVQLNSLQGNRTFTLSGTAIATPHDLTLLSPSNSALPLGQVVVGTSSNPGTVMIRSVGSSPLSISSVTVAGSGFALSSGNAGAHDLAPDTDEGFGVTCTPGAVGAAAGTLTIANNSTDSAEQSTVIQLSCEGIDSNLIVSPSPVQVPVTRVGESNVVTLSLSAATAGVAVTFNDVTINGAGLTITRKPSAGSSIVNTALPGGDIDVTFTPEADGDVNGLLTISHDGTSTREVSVIAPGRISTLSVSPTDTVDFGPICIGDVGQQVRIINNIGSAPFQLASVTPSGAAFDVSYNAPVTYPFTAAALGGSAVTFTVEATPAQGAQVGSIELVTDIPGEPAYTMGLTALGVPAGVSAAPAAVDFGSVVTGAGSALESVYLSNCVDGGLTITGAAVTGPDAADFVIAQAPPTLTLAPSEAAQWLLEMQPSSRGPKQAALEITYTGGTASIALSGVGDVDEGSLRGTYYACQASGGGSAGGTGLLLVALGLVLRRKRRR